MKKYFDNRASKAFILCNVLSFPFWGVFDLLPIILCKELNASPLQITTIIALKPLTALFASYWSSLTCGKQHRLVFNLLWAYILKFLPFVFVPFCSNPWIFILAFGMHMLLLRGTIPPWMEILKLNLSTPDRGKICSIGSSINYLGNALLPFLFGWCLDHVQQSWRWILLFTSLLGICSMYFISKIPQIPMGNFADVALEKEKLRHHVLKPWKGTRRLLCERPDFLRFQIGFFLGGAGLMLIQPTLPKYLTGNLQLSYTKLLLATCFCKGIGVVISSPFWVKLFNRSEIFLFCSHIPLIAAIFPIILVMAHFNLFFVFFAYLLYGVMQGGNELGWKMSGPVFAQETDSSPYSLVNILTVGIRGGIFPYFGTLLFVYGGAYLPLILGGFFCLMASIYLFKTGKKHSIYVNAPG